jgi:hypothetical protein
MTIKPANNGGENNGAGRTFGSACRECCEKILAQIREAKQAILAESREALKVPEQLLKLALNEAEALAWETFYPQLVFPALAVEKIHGVEAWNNRQRLLQARPLPF